MIDQESAAVCQKLESKECDAVKEVVKKVVDVVGSGEGFFPANVMLAERVLRHIRKDIEEMFSPAKK